MSDSGDLDAKLCGWSDPLEEGGTDADDGGPFFDGDFVVIAHAHREFGEVWSADVIGLDLFEEFSGACEDVSNDALVFGEWGHAHESAKAQAGEGVDLLGHVDDGADGEPLFDFFLAGVDFEEDVDELVARGGLTADLFDEAKTVDGMNEGGVLKDGLDLVALEVADHVPSWSGEGAGRATVANSGAHLGDHSGTLGEGLDAAFADVDLAEFEQGADDVDFEDLGDGDERYGFGIASGARTGGGDLVVDAAKVFVQLAANGGVCAHVVPIVAVPRPEPTSGAAAVLYVVGAYIPVEVKMVGGGWLGSRKKCCSDVSFGRRFIPRDLWARTRHKDQEHNRMKP